MSAPVLQSIGEAVGFLSLGGYTAWKAKRAEANTKSTSNGFAGTVTGALERIESHVERTEQKIDEHIAAHADNDIRRH